MTAARWENSVISASDTPVTSKRGWSEWRRARPSQPHPSASVNRSASTPWCSSESVDDGLEQATRIERPPDAVRDGAGPVGHHDMVVELGVTGPRVPVGERGGHHTLDVLLDHATLARARTEHLAFGVGQHDVDGPAVAVVDERLGLLVGQRPGHRHRLGWREREVEPGHGARSLPPRARSSASIRALCSARAASLAAGAMAATRSATRVAKERCERLGGRPKALPVTGSAHIPSKLNRCSSLTAEPFSTPRPSSRAARPAPRNTPGGVPDSA